MGECYRLPEGTEHCERCGGFDYCDETPLKPKVEVLEWMDMVLNALIFGEDDDFDWEEFKKRHEEIKQKLSRKIKKDGYSFMC